MSKEFEHWFMEYVTADAAKRYEPGMVAAFTAGRALGRREVKGECLAVTREFEQRPPMSRFGGAGDYMAKAIEAIPEEGV